MAIFSRLLLAIDLGPDSDQLLNRVSKICRENLGKVNVVHVLRGDFQDLPLLTGKHELDADQSRLRDQAIIKLSEILRRNNFEIGAEQIHIRNGEPANEIKKLAHEIEADLVIVGSHCKKGGWLELPGATTNCVLQGIDTDVMAVSV